MVLCFKNVLYTVTLTVDRGEASILDPANLSTKEKKSVPNSKFEKINSVPGEGM